MIWLILSAEMIWCMPERVWMVYMPEPEMMWFTEKAEMMVYMGKPETMF